MWQDYVITGASIIFVFSLIPQVFWGFQKKRGPIKLQTSVPTFLGLFFISVSYFTLGLFSSALMTFFTGLMWFFLFLQRIFYKE